MECFLCSMCQWTHQVTTFAHQPIRLGLQSATSPCQSCPVSDPLHFPLLYRTVQSCISQTHRSIEIFLLSLITFILTTHVNVYLIFAATMQIGTIAGIIGGCVAGVAVLVLLIYCCCRDKDQPEEFAME